jgi:hypothetical protein
VLVRRRDAQQRRVDRVVGRGHDLRDLVQEDRNEVRVRRRAEERGAVRRAAEEVLRGERLAVRRLVDVTLNKARITRMGAPCSVFSSGSNGVLRLGTSSRSNLGK